MTWTWWIVCHRQRERQTLPLGTAAVHLWKRKVRASPGAYHSKCVCERERERWYWQITVSVGWHLNTANSDILLFTRRRQQQLVIVFNPCNNNIQQHDVSLICRFCSGGFCGNYVAVVYIRVRNPSVLVQVLVLSVLVDDIIGFTLDRLSQLQVNSQWTQGFCCGLS